MPVELTQQKFYLAGLRSIYVTRNIDFVVQIDPIKWLLAGLVKLDLNQPMGCLRDQSVLCTSVDLGGRRKTKIIQT